MYLKRLELIGFKSFANRTELEFVPGVTAVVGPNGSGKSNISDSIRWVLGEQSAKSLRGSKMEDIIFAGSDARKPVNYCEVSLTLDNSDHTLKIDYSEVTISRRVYRSGESEYYINKQSCRLRDIIELFMDTGVGKEAYSIIGQGRIEEILSTKSEDRRGIIEEAAGIVKYKARKKEAEKKLDETEANLVRITDIISEISDQIEPLQEQANKAKHFLSLKKQLKEQEIGLYVHQIENVNLLWNETKKQVLQFKEQHAVKSSELSALDAELSSWRWKMSEQDELLEQWQVKLLHVSEEVEKTEGKREVLRERKKNVRENHKLAVEKQSQLKGRIEELNKQAEKEDQRLKELHTEWESVEQQLKAQEGLLGEVTKGLATDVEQLKSDYIELLNQVASSKNDLRHCEQAIEQSLRKREKLKEQLEILDRMQSEVNSKKEEAQKQLHQTATAIDQCLSAYKQGVQKYKEKQNLKEEQSISLRKLEQKMDSLSSRRDVLQEMQSAFTGFMQGVKEILKARENGFPGIQGAIAELLSVPSQYETALEVALGGSLQHVVVDNEAAGRKAIQWLKEKRLGRATFLPLDVIRSRRVSRQDETQLLQLKGIVGVASDLVQCEEKYQHISENLLGSVIVTETLEQANQAARKTGYRYRFVTLDGDVVNPGGAMTGGTVQQKSTNLLGRSRQLEELEQALQTTTEEKQTLVLALAKLNQELTDMGQEQEQQRLQGEQYRLQEQEAKGRLSQIDMEAQNYSERKKVLDNEWKAVTEEERFHQERKLTLEEQLRTWAEEEGALKQRISDIETHRSHLQHSKEEYSNVITNLKVRSAELRKQKEAVSTIIQRLKEESQTHRAEWNNGEEYIKNLQDLMEGNLDSEEQLDRVIQQFRTEKEEVGQQLLVLKQERAETMQQIEILEIETKGSRKQIKELEDRLHKEEMKAGRYDVELDNVLAKLQEEYELTYELAKERYELPVDPLATGELVNSLKKQIQGLGSVNLGAIEEYERQSERLQFLTGQSSDLDEAKQTLYKVIGDIEDEMSRRFLETFEQIRGEFQQVFTHLFVGGRADLQLSDPTQILTTGIDIVAQPPGKKLQNLALLSGGEKALTAIALLFAILRVKPVPFCVLDEVEAALDDANVYRFAEYLRQFSGQTQFICVTHRKGTMEGADVLYGVTMQEFGVSKLVSVKLEDKSFISETA
ncbi:chromosome segregation protein SMC [Ammoniphilus sp. CFH 90114]|uniref:chromosome segregation protein SMC n=1 Tax=Ammoniphilus sp. CFH 90114 TaxID=2493665 RepID=UPI00100F06D1|nr:chromosome segregation protein SMC [Ammoniphilus sp. CFH 90114]RXT15083.1 chromosome segregation protein SMC [Ammoniphilus sp. CFH 90114]